MEYSLFDKIATIHDHELKYLLPNIDDFFKACFPLVKGLTDPLTLLELEAGTGLFSNYIQTIKPDLQFTLIDTQKENLKVASERFLGKPNFKVAVHDHLSSIPLPGHFDIIISAFSTHQLDLIQETKLYNKVYEALKPDGLFINAVQVAGRSIGFDCYFQTHKRERLLESEIYNNQIIQSLQKGESDKFASLDSHLLLLENSGFFEVDCIYKYNSFVVMAASKGNLCY